MRSIYLLASLCLVGLLHAQQERQTTTLDRVAETAGELAKSPQQTSPSSLPRELLDLDYDAYRSIRFRPSEALWWNDETPYRVEFFHLGHIFTEPVEIYEISDSHIQKIPYLKNAFDYGKSGYNPSLIDDPSGYAGLRVKYPLNQAGVYDDLIVFQGASYFRALGQNQAYGLSMRGLTMNTTGEAEDFPRFTKLWLRRPLEGEKFLRMFALLEGEKVTGAYRFEIHPGGDTKIDVTARLFFREGGAAEVGIAPLTSMFVFGENSNHPPNDWRPEVHDSDGLLIHADLEWYWHPLENLPGRYTRQVPAAKLRGFGLMQRDRDFRNYQDLEANYEQRPSAWVTPKGKWPTGAVVLYTFGTDTEATDNVTAFWRPDWADDAPGPVELSYTIDLRLTDPASDLARVLQTRVGQRTLDPTAHTVVIEFSRPESITVNEIAALSAAFDTDDAELLEPPVIQHNAKLDTIRLFANIRTPARTENAPPYEMTAQLLRDGHQVSERWIYAWRP